MKSMTGYGYAEYQDDKIHLSIEIKSYNNRYLDIVINQPAFLNGLEPELRKYISSNAERGRVEVYLRVRELEEDVVFYIDKAAAKSYADALKGLTDAAGLDEKISLSHLLSFEGVLKSEKNRDLDEYFAKIMPLMKSCMSQWEDSRIKEGAETEGNIKSHLDVIYKALTVFEKNAAEMENHILTNIKTKFTDVLGDQLDEQRVLAETAVLLVKYSINEEISRLRGHLDSFSSALKLDEAIGKRLDFVCQEINREVNTIGSKSIIMEVNETVVSVKDSLENIREQLRNVE